MRKKSLVIINGVTGAIGTALLEQYGRLKNTVILGISRRAMKAEEFIDPLTGKIYASTCICSLSDITETDCENFVNLIDFEKFSKVTYIHCIGTYLFEIDHDGHFMVTDDFDRDGINDRYMRLSYELFRRMTVPLIRNTRSPLVCTIFGSLADRHHPRIIQSWWRTMSNTEEFMKASASDRVCMFKFNISSVFCPHELLTRPYVFVNTTADPRSWLSPYRLAIKVRQSIRGSSGSYHEEDIFNPWNDFFPEYYRDEHMVPRRLAEIMKRP